MGRAIFKLGIVGATKAYGVFVGAPNIAFRGYASCGSIIVAQR